HTVTLSDEEARRRHTTKTITERRAPPTFDIVVELVDHEEVVVHRDTAEAVDRLLGGQLVEGGRRWRVEGRVGAEERRPAAVPLPPPPSSAPSPPEGPLRLHAHALSRELLARVLRDLPVEARLVDRPDAADVVLTLR